MPTAEEWGEMIAKARKYRMHTGGSKMWPAYRGYLKNDFLGWGHGLPGNSTGILPYNISYAHFSTTVPQIYYRNPYIMVSPRNAPGREVAAKVIESVDNWMMEELQIKRFMRQLIQDAIVTGTGIGKIGYDSLYGYDSKLGKNSEFDPTKARRHSWHELAQPGLPWALRVMPESFYIPYPYADIESAPWVAHEIFRPLEDLKRDKKYTNTDKLTPTHVQTPDPELDNGHLGETADWMRGNELVHFYEIRDARTGTIVAVAPESSTIIRKEQDDQLQIAGLPFVRLRFNDDLQNFWGTGDFELLEPQQLEINDARTQAMRHRRLAIMRMIATRGTFDPDELEKLGSDVIGPIVIADNPVGPDQVQMITPHIPQDLLLWTQQMRDDARELIGTSENQAGMFSGGRKTAREVMTVQNAADLRSGARRDLAADVLQELFGKLNQVIFQFWEAERVVQVVGYDGARYWVKFTPEEIRLNTRLKIDVDSMTPETKQTRRGEIMQLMQVLGENPRVNRDYLLKMLLKEFDWLDAMALFPESEETRNGPMSARDFEGQQQQLLQNPKKIQSRAKENADHFNIKGVKNAPV